MEILAAFLIGLFGSFHCIGMCGPIALALPVQSKSNFSFLAVRIVYNSGRIISYTLMGLFFGFIGEKLVISGYQQALSIILGGIILLYLILPKKYKSKISGIGFIQEILSPLKIKISSLFRTGKHISFFTIGFLNGFLPCGFVYIGLAGAIAAGNALNGMLFMFLFGMGTFPVMFAVSIFGKFVSLNFRLKLTKLAPAFIVFFALLFILRGMNLGIPYISPKMDSTNIIHHNPPADQEMMCH